MASSSGFCSDEEFQKAMTDLHELISRNPILDEFKSLGGDKEPTKKQKEKKKLYRMHPEEVDMLLSFDCESQLQRFPKNAINKLAEEDPENHSDKKNFGRDFTSVWEALPGRHTRCPGADEVRAPDQRLRYVRSHRR
ncbi:hypothetical protein PVAP13_7KG311500 [Panicum virgatum]|uniref:Uncharacterized protein n=1 Tax=Panicum virgatum TaxID=38727 RepID=A0A8T0QGH9_PANVG|nr:hypothetical protein PVAP13_7KG311500 [Panicum virgatum]